MQMVLHGADLPDAYAFFADANGAYEKDAVANDTDESYAHTNCADANDVDANDADASTTDAHNTYANDANANDTDVSDADADDADADASDAVAFNVHVSETDSHENGQDDGNDCIDQVVC